MIRLVERSGVLKTTINMDHTGDAMNKALKIADIEKDSVKLNINNDAGTNRFTNLDADEIRAKIKAARLEKLMARQLESELSIELDTHIGSSVEEIDQNNIELVETEAPIALTTPEPATTRESAKIKTPASKARGYSAGSSKRMRNIQTTRHSCDEMITRIRSGSEILTDLNEQTTSLAGQLQLMEQEFAHFEEAEAIAAKLASDHKRVTNEYEEALNLIEKQNRQLDVLESQRSNSNSNYEKTKAELEKLQREYQKTNDLLTESQMVNSELEQNNRSFKNKIEIADTDISELNKELQSTSASLKQKDMEAARASAELLSTRERLSNTQNSLTVSSEELETVSKQLSDKEIENQNLISEVNELNEKLTASETSLESAIRDLENLTQEAHDKDMEAAKLTSDYSSLIKLNSKTMNDMDNLQNKYHVLNKNSLEQQSQQYARIHELESLLRDVNRKLELKVKETAELNVELEATNNLLILHEEMVAALSPEDRH